MSMEEPRALLSSLIADAIAKADEDEVDHIFLAVVACVFEGLSCSDCHSEIILSRQITPLGDIIYNTDIVHDDTCPAHLAEGGCNHCGCSEN